MLVIDHIVPVSEGGSDDTMNLQTACEECNLGKGAVPLGQVAPRPDADPAVQELKDLAFQQEMAELRSYQERESARQHARSRIIEAIQEDFDNILGHDWVPSELLLNQMLDRYSAVVVAEAAAVTARALLRKRIPGYTAGGGNAWVRYMWAVARNIAAERMGGGVDG